MKKILFCLLIIICAVFGYLGYKEYSKLLICKADTENFTAKVVIKFEEDKPIWYKYKDEMEFFGQIGTDSEFYYHSLSIRYDYLISERKAVLTNSGNKIKANIWYDFTKDSEAGDSLLLVGRNNTRESAKKKIESINYVCN